MKQADFLKSRLCLDLKSFERAMDKDEFYDFSFVNAHSAVVSFDNQTIISKNCPAVSSRVYSIRYS